MSFRICTIGCGAHASRVHGPSYRRYMETCAGTVLAACCDLDPVKARSFQETFGFQKFYTDIETMLAQEQPDAVCLVVSEALIAPLSVKILEAGFPLMMEKPPGLTREETWSMITAAEAAGVPNQVAFNRRYAPLTVKLKQLMDTNIHCRDIHHISYEFYRVDRKEEDFVTTAVHGISAVMYMAESPVRRARFTYQELPQQGSRVANIYMECEFESGAAAHLNFCPVAGVVVERATVNALDHTFFLELPVWDAYDHPGKLIHLEKGHVRKELTGRELAESDELFVTNGFYGENEAFFNSIREGRLPEGGLRSALQIVELADCIRLRKHEYVSSQPKRD